MFTRLVLGAYCALAVAATPMSAAVATYDFIDLPELPAGLSVDVGHYVQGGITNDRSVDAQGRLQLRFDFGRSIEVLNVRYYGEVNESKPTFTDFVCASPLPSRIPMLPPDYTADVAYDCFSDSGGGLLTIDHTEFIDDPLGVPTYTIATILAITIDIEDGVRGDTNADGAVDIADLNNVRNNFSGEGLGDANGDSRVDIEDLNLVRNNFGNALASVPEPSSWLLGLLMLTGLPIWQTRLVR